jgi:hypothetical protein
MPLSTGTNIILRSGQDPDALAYFARAGIASGTQTPSSYDNAASFNGTNQFLSVASNSSLQIGGADVTICAWAYFPAYDNYPQIIAKGNGNTLEYALTLQLQGVNFQYNDAGGVRRASPFVGPEPNRWNFICGTYNSATAVLGISLNGGAFSYSSSFGSNVPLSLTNPLSIGDWSNNIYSPKWRGSLSSIGFWKKALTASEVTQLWNNGAGRTYASLDSGLRTNLVSWWALNQNSVTADSHGTNTLTNSTPAVTAPNIGPIVTTTQNSRQLINNFVKGIKSLGLWNSMVCWPLRASQNAGSGLTARSLGGLGNFDGTLAGGTLPSWTANGLSLAASSQMNASVTTVPQNVTLLFAAAGNGGAQTGFAQYFGLQKADSWAPDFLSGSEVRLQDINSGNASNISLSQRNSTVVDKATSPTSNPFQNASNFAFVSGSLSQTSPILNIRNLNSGASATGTANTTGISNLNRIQLNGRFTSNAGLALGTPHTAAFCGYITPASDGQVSAIYSLYRNTLGIGLNLP